LAVLLGVAVLAMAVALLFAEAIPKQQIAVLAALSAVTIVVLFRRTPTMLLFAWVLLITYNRQYFSFEALTGDWGSQGLYWTPADAVLCVMLGIWAYDTVIRRRPLQLSWSPLAWFLPFIAVAGLSATAGAQIGWGYSELIRWLKIALIVIFLTHELRTRSWTCVAALGFAVFLQSGLGVLQVVLKSSTGLLSMFSGAGPEGGTIVATLNETARVRASGTMVHPNVLGPYLLFLLPLFLALAVGSTDRRVRWGSAFVCLLGYLGLVGTMSRLPIILGLIEAAFTLLVMVALWRVSATRVLAIGSVAGAIILGFGAIFVGEIHSRVVGDFEQSMKFRMEYNEVALEIWREHPLLGIGLNNFPEGLAEHSPRLAKIVDDMQSGRKKFGVRVAAPVHNLYLLILAETGAFGLVAFVVLLIGSLWTGLRAIALTKGPVQLMAIGLFVGLIAQFVQQTMDFSLWMDPGLVTFTNIFCLLSAALSNSGSQNDTLIYSSQETVTRQGRGIMSTSIGLHRQNVTLSYSHG